MTKHCEVGAALGNRLRTGDLWVYEPGIPPGAVEGTELRAFGMRWAGTAWSGVAVTKCCGDGAALGTNKKRRGLGCGCIFFYCVPDFFIMHEAA